MLDEQLTLPRNVSQTIDLGRAACLGRQNPLCYWKTSASHLPLLHVPINVLTTLYLNCLTLLSVWKPLSSGRNTKWVQQLWTSTMNLYSYLPTCFNSLHSLPNLCYAPNLQRWMGRSFQSIEDLLDGLPYSIHRPGHLLKGQILWYQLLRPSLADTIH